MVHRKPPLREQQKKKKKKKKEKMASELQQGGLLLEPGLQGAGVRPGNGMGAGAIRVPSIDRIVALRGQGTDVPKVHLKGI